MFLMMCGTNVGNRCFERSSGSPRSDAIRRISVALVLRRSAIVTICQYGVALIAMPRARGIVAVSARIFDA